jgi:hypothetical protein
MAIVRGKVGSEISIIKGDGSERCQFEVDVDLEEEKVESGKAVIYSVATQILATGDSELTEKIKVLLEKGDDVLLYGGFGYHNSRLKMKVQDIMLPDFAVHS